MNIYTILFKEPLKGTDTWLFNSSKKKRLKIIITLGLTSLLLNFDSVWALQSSKKCVEQDRDYGRKLWVWCTNLAYVSDRVGDKFNKICPE